LDWPKKKTWEGGFYLGSLLGARRIFPKVSTWIGYQGGLRWINFWKKEAQYQTNTGLEFHGWTLNHLGKSP